MTRRELILMTVEDLSGDLIVYDRREDEDLPQGDIEGAIAEGEITISEIITHFAHTLKERLND